MMGSYDWSRKLVPFLIGCCIGIWIERSWTKYPSNVLPLSDSSQPKITCLVILRHPHTRNIIAARNSWLKRCDNYIIVRARKRNQLFSKTPESCQDYKDVIQVEAENGWGFLCTSLHLLPRPLQWLIIVPDSLTVINENLRYFLHEKDWSKPAYFGHTVGHYSGDFNVLTAGIVLSNESVSRLLRKFPDNLSCQMGGTFWNNEDILLGQHLRELKITPQDSRDAEGRGRFHGYNLNTLLSPGKIFKQTDYFKKAVYPIKEGTDCCSPNLITLDASDSDHILIQYFLLYGVKLGQRTPQLTQGTPAPEDSWVQSLREIGYTGPTDGLTAEQYYDIWVKYMPPEALYKKIREKIEI